MLNKIFNDQDSPKFTGGLDSVEYGTHIAQKTFRNYLNKIQEFLSYNIKLRNKIYYELYTISNMDETSIYI